MKKILALVFVFLLAGCSKPPKNTEISFGYFVVVLSPIGNSTLRGLAKLHKDNVVNVDVFIAGLIPKRKYHFGIYEYGDLSSIDGRSSGELLLSEKTKEDRQNQEIIGDLGLLESDEQGLINRRIKTNISPALFNNLLGRSIVIKYEGRQNRLALGYGVIGIGNAALSKK